MSDMFHEDIEEEWLSKCFAVMNAPEIIAAGHIFQILTKRPERLAEARKEWWTENIWIGTSVEDKRNLGRLDALRNCPAKTRFVSFESLLEDLGKVNLSGIAWAIVGGESGTGFRQMNHAWARNIRDQCLEEGVEFFFKQSASFRTEEGTSLVEEDGSRNIWNYYPIDGQRFQDNGKPLPYIFEGYYEIEEAAREDVMARTEKIKTLVSDLRLNMIEVGKQLSDIHEILAKPGSGSFVSWLGEEFGWAKSTAYRFMDVYKRFGVFPNLGKTKIDQSALYKLAAESTPEDARQKAIQMADAGEKITMKVAETLISQSVPKPPPKPKSPINATPRDIVHTPAKSEVEPNHSEAALPMSFLFKGEQITSESAGELSELDSPEIILQKLKFMYGEDILQHLIDAEKRASKPEANEAKISTNL